MRNLLISVMAILLFILDQTFVPFLSINGSYGSLLFAFFGVFALLSDYEDAFLLAIVVGFLQDIYFPYVFGLNILTNLILFFGLSKAGETLKEGRKTIPVFFVTLAQGGKNFLMVSILSLFGYHANFSSVLIAPIFTFVFAIFLYNRVIAFRRIPMIKKEWKF